MMLAIFVSYTALILLGYDPSIAILFRDLIMKGCWILSIFFCIYWNSHVTFVLDSTYVICDVLFYWIAYVELSLHPWNKANVVTVWVLFMCCWIHFVSILLRIFIFMFNKDISLQFSFLVASLSNFGIKVTLTS
jgi:hypothetical protein